MPRVHSYSQLVACFCGECTTLSKMRGNLNQHSIRQSYCTRLARHVTVSLLGQTRMIFSLPFETFCQVFDDLLPVDLIHFSWSCRKAYSVITDYSQYAFNLYRVLSPYLSTTEVEGLRFLLCYTGAFISGSTAVQFFERTKYPNSDLDFYVEWQYCDLVLQWFRSIGYSSDTEHTKQNTLSNASQSNASHDNSAYYQHSRRKIHAIFNLYRDGQRKIQVISVRCCPLKIVLTYHSTCVMNIITHNAAYSLFPHATFQQHRSLVLKTPGIKQRHARQKYIERGWRMQYRIYIREILNPRSDFHACWRSTSDERCWKIKLNPLQDLPQDDVEENHWGISYTDASTAKICIAHLKTRICTDNQAVSRHVFSQIVSSASS